MIDHSATNSLMLDILKTFPGEYAVEARGNGFFFIPFETEPPMTFDELDAKYQKVIRYMNSKCAASLMRSAWARRSENENIPITYIVTDKNDP